MSTASRVVQGRLSIYVLKSISITNTGVYNILWRTTFTPQLDLLEPSYPVFTETDVVLPEARCCTTSPIHNVYFLCLYVVFDQHSHFDPLSIVFRLISIKYSDSSILNLLRSSHSLQIHNFPRIYTYTKTTEIKIYTKQKRQVKF